MAADSEFRVKALVITFAGLGLPWEKAAALFDKVSALADEQLAEGEWEDVYQLVDM